MPTGSAVITAEKDVVSCELGDGSALLDMRSGTYFSVNAVGAYVWELLDSPRTFSDLRDAIVERYDVAPDRCEQDLAVLCDQLAEAELVQVSDGSGD